MEQRGRAKKYVLFGAASSAMMLYGISLLYGLGGSLNVFDMVIAYAYQQANPAFRFPWL